MASKSLIAFGKKNIWTSLFTTLICCLTAVSIMSIFSILVIKQVSDPLSYSDHTKITVYAFPESTKKMTQDKAHVIESYLKENTSIQKFERVPDEKIKNLINKFIKFDAIIENMQLPIVFQVSLIENAPITHHELEFALNNKAEKIFVESKNDSIKALSSKVLGIKGILTLIPFLSLFVLLSSVGIFVVTLLYLHKEELNVLMFLGASIVRISKEYSYWIAKIALKGSLFGVFLGAIISTIIAVIFKLVAFLSLLFKFAFVLVFVPFVFAIITYILASIIILNITTKVFQK